MLALLDDLDELRECLRIAERTTRPPNDEERDRIAAALAEPDGGGA